LKGSNGSGRANFRKEKPHSKVQEITRRSLGKEETEVFEKKREGDDSASKIKKKTQLPLDRRREEIKSLGRKRKCEVTGRNEGIGKIRATRRGIRTRSAPEGEQKGRAIGGRGVFERGKNLK